jgi:predicted porin
VKAILFVAAATTFSVGATAQSNVTMYGLIDMSVNYAHFNANGTKPSQHLTTVSNDASRLGFRGSEDLGGGMQAYFKLESGVSLDTGSSTSATQFFNRESYVGLGDKSRGWVQLGSQFTPTIWTSGKVDPFARFGLGAILGILQGPPRGWAVTFNNAVQYLTPDFYGLSGKLMVAAGEGAVTGRSYAASAEYTRGPLYLAINYDAPKTSAASVGLTGDAVQSKTFSAGATYDFGVVKLAGWYQTNRIENLPNVNGYMAGITVPAGTGEIRASYTHRSQLNADASQSALGYYYFMSKRTWLFGQIGRLNNSGTAAFGLGPARLEEAAAGVLNGGRDITGLQLGIRHFF